MEGVSIQGLAHRNSWRLTLLIICLASCRITPQTVLQSQETHRFDRLNIIYCTDSPTGPLFSELPKDARSKVSPGILQASASELDDLVPFDDLSWSKAELRVECPHPDGRPDVALVTLSMQPWKCGQECDFAPLSRRIEEQIDLRQARREARRERLFNWRQHHRGCYTEMELPRSELEGILAELNAHGFFAETASHQGSTSHLEVRLNRQWTSKPWGYEPVLDTLTARVYEHGRPFAAAKSDVAIESNRPLLSHSGLTQ